MSKNKEEKNTWIWFIVGFLFPLVGIILFFVWLKNKKKSSKMSIYGVIASFVFCVIFYAFIWPMIQRSIVETTCQTYGEDYHAYRGSYMWCCKNSNDELIGLDGLYCSVPGENSYANY